MSIVDVSVVVPFLDAGAHLGEALDSISCQTYSNFEVLAVDDGSADQSREIVDQFAQRDGRFRLLANKYDKGIVGALNTGLDHARGTFVARMDADDIALQNRLFAQVKFLESHSQIALCGSFVRTFGATTPTTWALPTDHRDIKATMLFHGAIAHPAVMLRRAAFERANLRYDQDFVFAEDLELWERASQTILFANVPRILMRYRVNSAGVTAVRRDVQLSRTEQILHRAVSRLGIEPDAEEWRVHLDLANHGIIAGDERIALARRWFDRIIAANARTQVYDPIALRGILEKKASAFRRSPTLSDRAGVAVSRAKNLVKRATPAHAHAPLARAKNKARDAGRHAIGVDARKRLRAAVAGSPKPRIAMAVLVHERPDYLEKCLDSLFSSDIGDVDIRFFLLDDGSVDPGVRQLVEQPRSENYRIERHFLSKGAGTAGSVINRALKLMLAAGDFDIVGWSDPDALYHPDWLKNMLAVCLWARQHHRKHTLGPFCCFNSSDEEYHRVLGRFTSPSGDYVVKRQMGMLNYFFFKSDLEVFGVFDEGPDDETLMTVKLEKKGIRNFCTFNSYAEHLGQVSSLARWRPSGLSRAVHGLHLVPRGWPKSLATAETLGYYSDVIGLPAAETASSVPLDVVYVATDRDIDTMALSVESVRRNLLHPVRDVLFIAPFESSSLRSLARNLGARFVDEDDVMPVRKKDIRYAVDGVSRQGWLFQQLLKFAAAEIVGSDRYLVVDADTVLVRPQAFVRPSGDLLLHSSEFHGPYVEAYCRLVNEPAKTMLSSVNHHMMFNVARVRSLLAHGETEHGAEWPLAILNATDLGIASGFSEYLAYGLWCLSRYESETVREYGFNKSLTRDCLAPLDELTGRYGEQCRSVSFHWYLEAAPRQARRWGNLLPTRFRSVK
jgi:glycosyltransferase involved in cell wall biosynthesis